MSKFFYGHACLSKELNVNNTKQLLIWQKAIAEHEWK